MDSKEDFFKQTEVGLIPEEWRVSTLSGLVMRITKGTTPTTIGGKFVASGINFVKVESLNDDGTINKEKFMHIDEETNTLLSRSRLQTNDLLYSIAGTIGRVSIVTEDILPANTNQAVAIIRPNLEKISLQYLRYALINPELKKYLLSKVVHAVQANLSLTEIGNCPIPVPKPDEQQSIAKILSNLDSKIELNQRMNKTLEAVGEAVFRRWFVDFEFPDLEGKPYRSSGGKMVYNSALNKEIPAKWVAKEIGELAKINEHSINKDFKYSEIEYIDIDSVDQGIIRNPQILRLADAPSRAKRIVKNQDIIISTVRPNLKHFAFIQNAKPNTIVSTGFAVISPMKGNSKFLYYHITTDKYTNYLSAIADSHTSTYPSFNPDIIQKSLVAYPDENEQQMTTNLPSQLDLIMEGLFGKVENNSKQISTLSRLRDMLLPKLMSGKIRVPIPSANMETT